MSGETKPVILCVDYDAGALFVRQRLLERFGYEVLTATTPQEALSLFKSHPVNLVLTEYVLKSHGMSAAELAHWMKCFRPSVPIAFYSGVFQRPKDTECVDAFISKNIGINKMLESVAKLATTN